MRNLVNWTCATSTTMKMYLIILIGFITSNCMGHAILLSGDLPCDFLDSIDINGGEYLSNRTFVYKDMEFPIGQYAKINYTIDNGIERTSVAPYMRGCLCNRRPCIRLCCPFGYIQVTSRQCQPNEAANSIKIIADQNQTAEMQKYIDQFVYIHGYPCKRLHFNTDYIITTVSILFPKSNTIFVITEHSFSDSSE